jgi:hypothetical protein
MFSRNEAGESSFDFNFHGFWVSGDFNGFKMGGELKRCNLISIG